MSKADVAEFVEWDVRNWAVALDFWSRHSALDFAACSALEIGSRHGGLSLWMALQGARVVCSDVNGPTSTAVQKHRVAGISDLVEYQSIDATTIPYADHFDIVLFKSVLNSIGGRGGKEAQLRAVAEMHKALKSGGELFFADNLVGSAVHRFLRRRFGKHIADRRFIALAAMLGIPCAVLARGLLHRWLLGPVGSEGSTTEHSREPR